MQQLATTTVSGRVRAWVTALLVPASDLFRRMSNTCNGLHAHAEHGVEHNTCFPSWSQRRHTFPYHCRPSLSPPPLTLPSPLILCFPAPGNSGVQAQQFHADQAGLTSLVSLNLLRLRNTGVRKPVQQGRCQHLRSLLHSNAEGLAEWQLIAGKTGCTDKHIPVTASVVVSSLP